MRKLAIFIFLFPFTAFGQTSQSECFTVSGAGLTSVNGFYEYSPTSMQGITPKTGTYIFRNSVSGEMYNNNDQPFIQISDDNYTGGSYYVSNVTYTDFPSASGHFLGYSGDYSNPESVTVVLDDCPSGGGSIDTSTYGSSTQQYTPTLGDVSFGLGIIIVMLSIATTAYIWNSITSKKKKPWLS